MKSVTMLKFRQDAEGILRRLAKGERFVLSHRGKPAARLEPLAPSPSTDPASDPFLAIARRAFENLHIALHLRRRSGTVGVVTGHADGVYQADIKFAGDQRGRNKPAAGDGDDAFPGTFAQQFMAQKTGVAMQFDPGDQHIVFVRIACHTGP